MTDNDYWKKKYADYHSRSESRIAELKTENDRLKKCNEELTSDNLNTIQEMDNERRRVEQLKEENERLVEVIKQLEDFVNSSGEIDHINHEYTYKLKQTLQEIKELAENLLEKGLEPQSVEHQLRLRGKRELASIIIDLITKAESEG